MVESLNSSVDFTSKATSYFGVTSYGKLIVGNHGVEYYNDSNEKDFIQIPYKEIEQVIASIMFKGKWIPRFAIVTKANGNFTFSTRDNKRFLKTLSKYIESDRLVRSLSFFQVINRGIKSIFKKH